MRVVLDTNVVVSALLFGASVPGRAFVRVLDRGTILISRSFVRELDDVLRRDKFDRYLSREERDRFLESLIRESELIEITESVHACRDPDDDRRVERRRRTLRGHALSATYGQVGGRGDACCALAEDPCLNFAGSSGPLRWSERT